MFLLNFIRYLRGYVTFRARGTFVERFLNLAARNKIPIWGSIKRGDSYTGNTLACSYKKLRHHAKKSHVTLRVIDKRGMPFRRRKYRKRAGLLVGLGIFCAFIFLTSRFIWRVEVNGNERVAESDIIAALEEIGVTPGKMRSSINVRAAERRALLALDDLSWIALNMQGSAVHVEVRERGAKPVMVDPRTPCNIVASRSGQITSMIVFDGQAMKSVGDTVLDGDILASGIMQDRLGQNLFKHARAKVMARVQHNIIVEVPLEQQEFVETGEVKSRRFLHVFDWDLPIFWPRKIPQPYRVERDENMLSVADTTLPIGILSEKYILMKQVPKVLTGDEARLLALKELNIRQQADLDGAEILDKTAHGSLDNGIFTLNAEYLCMMDIAKEKEILKSE